MRQLQPLILAFAASIASAQQRDITIPLRAIGPLTGPVSSFGINSRAALAAASRRIDETGGVRLANGARGHFAIAYADDHCDASDGIALLKQAALSDALALIGPGCSSVAEPMYGVLQHRAGDAADAGFRIPVFTDGATKANLARISEWAFRNSPNERDMYRALWRWVRVRRPELTTVFAGEEADFAHSHSTLHNIILEEASANGFIVQGQTQWSIHDSGFAAPAAAIEKANASVVVVSAHALTTCGVLKELARRQYRPQLLVGLTSASTAETLKLCGREAEGLLIPTSFIANSEERKTEQRDIERAGGSADLHSMAAWEILYTLKRVIESRGIVPGREAVASGRESLREGLAALHNMDGAMGSIARTPDRESLKPFVLVQAKAGAWETVFDPGEHDVRIPFGNGGLHLFLRHLPPAGPRAVPRGPVLFVHGASFPSGLAAAFPFGGRSWMRDLAEHGFDVWALDFMGFGGSSRYPEMRRPAAAGTPLLESPEAAEQIAAASEFIRKTMGAAKISLIAHSWGTLPAGVYAMNHSEALDRLVMFGPLAARNGAAPKDVSAHPTLDVTVAGQMERFHGYVPAGQVPVLNEDDMRAWGAAYLASDPESGSRTPPAVRIPSGPSANVQAAWSGSFPYQPEKITVPVLIVRGEWDSVTRNGDAEWLYSRLTAAPIRRDVRISRGSHVMHLEESRFQLYREVQTFLEGER